MMKNDNIVHICETCKREFPSPKSLYGHQRIHKRDKDELERQLKKTKPSYSPGQGPPLCLSRDPIESISVKRTTTFPSLTKDNTDVNMPVGPHPVAPARNTSYGFSSGTPLVTHNPTLSNFNRMGISFGPFKSGGGGSSHDYPYSSLLNRGITMAPPATPNRSRDPLPYYRYNNSHAFSLEHSLGSANSIGSFSNNSSSQGSLSLELSLGPPKSMGDSNNKSSSQDSLSLELSLGPSKSSYNSSSAYPSFIVGETTNLNRPVRPRVSRFHFHSHNPLDRITRNVPDENNVPGSSNFKTKPYDEKDIVVIRDHDEDKPEEVEAKRRGRDSSSSL